MNVINIEKAASKGIAMGKAFILKETKVTLDTAPIKAENAESEVQRFKNGVAAAVAEIKKLAEKSDIFGAHVEVAEDIALHELVETKINDELKKADLALQESVDEIVVMFESLDDEYLRERASDIKDVGKRILYKILGIAADGFDGIDEQSIIIAKDLTPSDTANMDFKFIKGFVTQLGGVTSHVAIMARSLELPAFVGVYDIFERATEDSYIIIDGIENKVIIDPDEETKALYIEKAEEFRKVREELLKLNSLPATTLDGRTVELFANAGSIIDVQNATLKGAEGIGLFRSEFLYMESDAFPTEEEQFKAYKDSAMAIGKPIIIRTLDIGGDKELSYYKFDVEENPFLGWRAIRISLDLKDVFKTQLRALLRASAFGDIRIMYPMIISLEEFRMANEVLEECKAELRTKNIAFNDKIQTGIMIETPAGVLMADELAAEVDFFSIGTNDLTQYLLAVDRGNQKIAKLYNSYHPAVLRAIKKVINAGHKHGKIVGMCGEFASDEKSSIMLLGMGLDEYSVTAAEIPQIRYRIRNVNYEAAKAIADEVLKQTTIEDVLKVLA